MGNHDDNLEEACAAWHAHLTKLVEALLEVHFVLGVLGQGRHAAQVQLVTVLRHTHRRVDVGRCVCVHLLNRDLSVAHDEVHELAQNRLVWVHCHVEDVLPSVGHGAILELCEKELEMLWFAIEESW